MLKNIFKIILFLIVVGAAIVVVLIIGSRVDETENINDTINKTNEITNNTNAKTIVEHVEEAYSLAYVRNYNYPTLEQVKSNFQLNKATWNDNSKIEAENFDCTVEVIDNNLKVTCLDHVTSGNLKLSN